jgi:clan AA aspartic protease (TIGR02281 family)
MLNTYPLKLMIDTGASTTVISRAAFNRVTQIIDRYTYVGQYQVNTASGRVTAPLYRFEQLSITHHSVKDIAVLVLPLQQLDNAEGLLGMNFLREFEFFIDQANDALILR